jgi:ferric-dicitrate binding protein FerR (iron transport regulator)
MNQQDYETLIHRYLDGIATNEEVAQLSQQLESDAEMRLSYLRLADIHASLAMTEEFDEPRSESETQVLEFVSQLEQSNPSSLRRPLPFALGTAAVVMMMICAWTVWKTRPSSIATITAIEGVVEWIGDGGQVNKDLHVGRSLTRGTIEASSVDSFLELRFRDGSVLSTSEGAVLTIADQGQKSLHLRSGVLSAEVEKQPTNRPMILNTPAARFEILGTKFDVVASDERSKVSVKEGLVQAVRLTDGKSVKIGADHSTIIDLHAQSELVARRSDQSVTIWKADLEKDRKVGEGRFESPLHLLRREIRSALGQGALTSEQIPDVYGQRIRAAMDKEGVVKAQTKSIGRGRSGEAIQIVTLTIRSDEPNPVVLTDQSQFWVQGMVLKPTKIQIGFGAFGTARANAGRFMTSRNVENGFDLHIPIHEFRSRRERNGGNLAVGMEVFTWFCLTSDPEAELSISHVELTPATKSKIVSNEFPHNTTTEHSRE